MTDFAISAGLVNDLLASCQMVMSNKRRKNSIGISITNKSTTTINTDSFFLISTAERVYPYVQGVPIYHKM